MQRDDGGEGPLIGLKVVFGQVSVHNKGPSSMLVGSVERFRRHGVDSNRSCVRSSAVYLLNYRDVSLKSLLSVLISELFTRI